MKILFVTDLHYHEPWYQWLRTRAPYHDLLVIGGDLLDQNHPASQEKQICNVTEWIERLSQPVFICSGNHDRMWNSVYSRWERARWLTSLSRAGLRTRRGVIRYRGVSFLIHNFREPIAPGRAKVWIAHMPPSGTAVAGSTVGAADGDARLAAWLKRRRPKLLLCGHQHTPTLWRAQVGQTLCLNPGINWGAAVPNHIVIDTDAATACWKTSDATSAYVEKIEIPVIRQTRPTVQNPG